MRPISTLDPRRCCRASRCDDRRDAAPPASRVRSAFTSRQPRAASSDAAMAQEETAAGAFPLRIAVREMLTDVALAQRAEDRVAERMQQHVTVGARRRPCRAAPARRPASRIPRPESMHVVAVTDAHPLAFPAKHRRREPQILRLRHLDVIGATGHEQRAKTERFHGRGFVGDGAAVRQAQHQRAAQQPVTEELRGSRPATDLHVAQCRRLGCPVRRASGCRPLARPADRRRDRGRHARGAVSGHRDAGRVAPRRAPAPDRCHGRRPQGARCASRDRQLASRAADAAHHARVARLPAGGVNRRSPAATATTIPLIERSASRARIDQDSTARPCTLRLLLGRSGTGIVRRTRPPAGRPSGAPLSSSRAGLRRPLRSLRRWRIDISGGTTW